MAQRRLSERTERALHECTALEYILLGDLRELLDEPLDDQNKRWLLAVLETLLDTIPQEMALLEDGGYLDSVTDEFPNWSPLVVQLQREHASLTEDLSRLRDRIAWGESIAELTDELHCDLRRWMTCLAAHQRHARRIVQTAFNLDVGGGD